MPTVSAVTRELAPGRVPADAAIAARPRHARVVPLALGAVVTLPTHAPVRAGTRVVAATCSKQHIYIVVNTLRG